MFLTKTSVCWKWRMSKSQPMPELAVALVIRVLNIRSPEELFSHFEPLQIFAA
jgi:hypothetical protein